MNILDVLNGLDPTRDNQIVEKLKELFNAKAPVFEDIPQIYNKIAGMNSDETIRLLQKLLSDKNIRETILKNPNARKLLEGLPTTGEGDTEAAVLREIINAGRTDELKIVDDPDSDLKSSNKHGDPGVILPDLKEIDDGYLDSWGIKPKGELKNSIDGLPSFYRRFLYFMYKEMDRTNVLSMDAAHTSEARRRNYAPDGVWASIWALFSAGVANLTSPVDAVRRNFNTPRMLLWHGWDQTEENLDHVVDALEVLFFIELTSRVKKKLKESAEPPSHKRIEQIFKEILSQPSEYQQIEDFIFHKVSDEIRRNSPEGLFDRLIQIAAQEDIHLTKSTLSKIRGKYKRSDSINSFAEVANNVIPDYLILSDTEAQDYIKFLKQKYDYEIKTWSKAVPLTRPREVFFSTALQIYQEEFVRKNSQENNNDSIVSQDTDFRGIHFALKERMVTAVADLMRTFKGSYEQLMHNDAAREEIANRVLRDFTWEANDKDPSIPAALVPRLTPIESLYDAGALADTERRKVAPMVSEKKRPGTPSPEAKQYRFIFTWWAFHSEKDFKTVQDQHSYPRMPGGANLPYQMNPAVKRIAEAYVNNQVGKVTGVFLGFMDTAPYNKEFGDAIVNNDDWSQFEVIALGAAIPFPHVQQELLDSWSKKLNPFRWYRGDATPNQADLEKYGHFPPEMLQWRWTSIQPDWLKEKMKDKKKSLYEEHALKKDIDELKKWIEREKVERKEPESLYWYSKHSADSFAELDGKISLLMGVVGTSPPPMIENQLRQIHGVINLMKSKPEEGEDLTACQEALSRQKVISSIEAIIRWAESEWAARAKTLMGES